MCRLSFFASNVSDVASQLDARADSLQDLHSKGFRDTDKASQFLRLERDLGYLTTPLVVQPYENLYWVDSSPLVVDTITHLRDEAAKLRSVDPATTVSDFVNSLRESTRLAREAVEKAASASREAERVARATAEFRLEMDALLAAAAATLEAEKSSSSSSSAVVDATVVDATVESE